MSTNGFCISTASSRWVEKQKNNANNIKHSIFSNIPKINISETQKQNNSSVFITFFKWFLLLAMRLFTSWINIPCKFLGINHNTIGLIRDDFRITLHLNCTRVTYFHYNSPWGKRSIFFFSKTTSKKGKSIKSFWQRCTKLLANRNNISNSPTKYAFVGFDFGVLAKNEWIFYFYDCVLHRLRRNVPSLMLI